MSHAVLLCWRNKDPIKPIFQKQRSKHFLKDLSVLIIPPDINAETPLTVEDDALFAAVLNPKSTIGTYERCFFLGAIQASDDWYKFGTNSIEGSYSIFRTNEKKIELVTDAVASRTIWYYFDDSVLIASSSQVAITFVLGSFEANEENLIWMMSNGTLGPGLYGWDKRIKRIDSDTIVSLDRRCWVLRTKKNPVFFKPLDIPRDAEKETLRCALEKAVQSLNLQPHEWSVLLSGGYDSRAILSLLGKPEQYRTITWGLSSSQFRNNSDGSIARMLAEEFGTKHKYFELDEKASMPQTIEDAESIILNFLQYGDGRSDNISGYMDNFSVWKSLSIAGVQGVVRGDEGFGFRELQTESQVRLRLGAALWSDFANVPPLESFNFFQEQEFPIELERQVGETLETWRDRLYHSYRIPVVLAALNDLKTPFVEIANPLLSRSIIEITRGLSDSQRTEKSLFREIVKDIAPKIPFAKYESTLTLDGALSLPMVSDYLQQLLDVDCDRYLLPRNFLRFARSGLSAQSMTNTKNKTHVQSTLRSFLPPKVKNWLQKNVLGTRLDGNIIAFRCVIIILMQDRLKHIAQLGADGSYGERETRNG